MLLEIKNLSVMYPDSTVALGGVSFSLNEKHILALAGESGSGKSTIALSLMGLLPLHSVVRGKMVFEGKEIDLTHQQYFERLRGTRIGFIMQDPLGTFNPVLNIGYHFHELLICRAGIHSFEEREKLIFSALSSAGLKPNQALLKSYAHQFSGGQLQRISIAMAIVLKPALIIADEPTSALDVVVESGIIDLFKDLKNNFDGSIIFITHNLGVARVLADDILVLSNGDAREYGKCEDIFNNPQDSYTKKLLMAYKALEG